MPEGVAVSRDKPRGRNNQNLGLYDQDLLRAKNKNLKVTFTLAQDADFTNPEGEVTGTVKSVDRYSVKIVLGTSGREIWIAKPMIVGTEVHG